MHQVRRQVVEDVLGDELALAAVAVEHAHERALRVASEARAHAAAVLIDLGDGAAGARVDGDTAAREGAHRLGRKGQRGARALLVHLDAPEHRGSA